MSRRIGAAGGRAWPAPGMPVLYNWAQPDPDSDLNVHGIPPEITFGLKRLPMSHLTADDLRQAFAAATRALERHREAINALNVFPVPDGDTDKISTAAAAWDRLATVHQTTTVAEGLGVDARAFQETHSPEVEYIVGDLEELQQATTSVLNGCAELAQSCADYKTALDDLRTSLEGILEDLAVELATTAAVGVAASFVSFGAGAVAATAKAAHSVTKYARIIAEAVSAWKISKNISKGVKSAHDIVGVRHRLQRIKNLGRKNKPEEKPPPPRGTDPQLQYNTRPERMDHVFAEKHKLDGVVQRSGGREEAIKAMLNELNGNVPAQGTFEKVIRVSGEDVTVRGFVDNGVIKIGTAFIP